MTAQPAFLNICVVGKTGLSPEDLLLKLKSVEKRLGRSGGKKWGPREIDIDIIFYGSHVVGADGLKIPHPQMSERAFVLVPLNEIAKDFIHPTINKSVSELLSSTDKKGVKKADE